jgi:N-carbamoylputrescine amidase
MPSPHQEQLTVALIQHTCSNDKDSNLDHIKQQIGAASQQGAQLILLQELHNSRYFCQTEESANFDLSETIPGPTTGQLEELAKANEVVIVASLFERRAPGLHHNTAVVLDSDGSLAGCYRKMHIPDDPGYYEKFYFTPGDLGFRPIETRLGRLGVLVCWDQWYPEAARLMALAGADILLYPTAIGWDPQDDEGERQRQLDAWMTVQRGHAIANALPLLACNRCGFEPDPGVAGAGINFWGNSFISGPQGEILARAGEKPELLVASVERKRTEELRRIWPFFRDRRIDAYGPILQRYDD